MTAPSASAKKCEGACVLDVLLVERLALDHATRDAHGDDASSSFTVDDRRSDTAVSLSFAHGGSRRVGGRGPRERPRGRAELDLGAVARPNELDALGRAALSARTEALPRAR